MESATVTILMAVKNEALHIRQALESLQAQTYPGFEVIVCNDHSTDDTETIVADLAAEDPRVRLLNNPGKGKTAAYNAAFAHSRGSYFTFMGGDDYLPPRSLETRLRRLETSGATISVCGYTTVSEDTAFDGNVRLPVDGPGLTLWSGGLVLFNTDFARILFPLPEDVPSEDSFAYYLALADVFSIEGIGESQYHYRIHDGNSYSKGSMYNDLRVRFEKDVANLDAAKARLQQHQIGVPSKISALREGRSRSLKGASMACLWSPGLSNRERLRFYWQSDPRIYNSVRRVMMKLGHK